MTPDVSTVRAKSGKIGAYRAASVYQVPFKKGLSTSSRVINEVVLEAVREGSSTSEPPQHQATHDRVDHGLATLTQPLVILAHPPALREPANGSFCYPAPR